MATGKFVAFHPDGKIVETRIDRKAGPNVAEIRNAIGNGYFTIISTQYEGRTHAAYVDEEGDPKKLPINGIATDMVQQANPQGYVPPIRGILAVWVPDGRKPLTPESRLPSHPPEGATRPLRRMPKRDIMSDALRLVAGELAQLADDMEQNRTKQREIHYLTCAAQVAIYAELVEQVSESVVPADEKETGT